MRPSRDPRASLEIPGSGRAAHLPNAGSRSNSMGRVPQLNLSQAIQELEQTMQGPGSYGPLPSAMDTTRSQHLANCSDCMMPCKVLLGISVARESKHTPSRRSAPKKSALPLRPVMPDSAGVPRSGRSVSVSHPGARSGSVANAQPSPGLLRPVPVVVYPPTNNTPSPLIPQRRETAGTYQTLQPTLQGPFVQGQQGLQYPVTMPPVSPAQSVAGVSPVVAPAYLGQAPAPVQSVPGITPFVAPAYIGQAPAPAAPSAAAVQYAAYPAAKKVRNTPVLRRAPGSSCFAGGPGQLPHVVAYAAALTMPRGAHCRSCDEPRDAAISSGRDVLSRMFSLFCSMLCSVESPWLW